ncbi:hypothetical protein BC938DRAFT_481540 [Jimgerdemannia flammicorona]|uniref:Uncharacterized protein n=1 Tax=Jimgerdemannia flammicorona TaxID=994334 RepID=A0A433QGK3_9FUNG|nr:hypothetical protein BC938DRAFT_481540 [Jimgerdemannia flammicorona]
MRSGRPAYGKGLLNNHATMPMKSLIGLSKSLPVLSINEVVAESWLPTKQRKAADKDKWLPAQTTIPLKRHRHGHGNRDGEQGLGEVGTAPGTGSSGGRDD